MGVKVYFRVGLEIVGGTDAPLQAANILSDLLQAHLGHDGLEDFYIASPDGGFVLVWWGPDEASEDG